MKKLLIITILCLFFIQGICLADYGESKFVSLTIDDLPLEMQKENALTIHKNQISTMYFYYNTASSFFATLKDSKGQVVKYYGSSYLYGTMEQFANHVAIQEIEFNDTFKKNSKFTIDIYDTSDIKTNGTNKASSIATYTIVISNVLEESQHSYDTATKKCQCGARYDIEYYNHHDDGSEKVEDGEIKVYCKDLNFVSNNKKVDVIDVEITSENGDYNNKTTISLDKFVKKEDPVSGSVAGILVEPSSYNFTYYYDYPVLSDMKPGYYTYKLMMGSTIIGNKQFRYGSLQFNDLSKDHWAYKYITILANENLLNGYEDGSFKPEKAVTREEFVTMLSNIDMKLNAFVKAKRTSFIDVNESRWSFNDCSNYGYPLIDYDGNNAYFYPSRVITREEASKLLTVLLLIYGNPYTEQEIASLNVTANNTLSKFTDLNQTSDEFKAYIYKAITTNLFAGVSENSFDPKGSITRAQAATLMYRIGTTMTNIKLSDTLVEDTPNIPTAPATSNDSPFVLQPDGSYEMVNPRKYIYNLFEPNSWYYAKINDMTLYINTNKDSTEITTHSFNDITLKAKETRSYSLSFDNNRIPNTSYINTSAKNFNYTFEYDYNNEKYITRCSLDGKNYTYTMDTSSNQTGYLQFDMELFMLANANKIEGGQLTKLNVINPNLRNEWDTFYKNKKSFNLPNNSLSIKATNKNEFVAKIKDTEESVNVDNCIKTYSTSSEYPFKTLSPELGFYVFDNLSAFDNLIAIFYKDEVFVVNRLDYSNIQAKDFYAYLFYFINNHYNETANSISYTLSFNDVIESIEKTSFNFNNELVLFCNSYIVFKEKVKSCDVDVINNDGESCKVGVTFDDNPPLGNGKANYLGRVIKVSYLVQPGKEYYIVLKNFNNANNQATPTDQEFKHKLDIQGTPIPSKGKYVDDIIIENESTYLKDGEIRISLNGDLKAKQRVVAMVGVKNSFGSGSGRGINFGNGVFKMDDLLKTTKQLQSSDDTIYDTGYLELYIQEYQDPSVGYDKMLYTKTIKFDLPRV